MFNITLKMLVPVSRNDKIYDDMKTIIVIFFILFIAITAFVGDGFYFTQNF